VLDLVAAEMAPAGTVLAETGSGEATDKG
jgi:hypothetical protein